ncbi:MAG: MerR family transcriptional regulator [Gemmatimonadaceae bacterium]|nr:MerR family transcriptional regulator [Gemmatimonadaceae bacterium]
MPVEFTIGVFAAEAGVTVETIRFYQRKGLIREPSRALGGIRRYDASDIARVRFVKAAQNLGFSLDEIASLLRLEDGAHCDEARVVAEEKLAGVRVRLADLRRIETVLGMLVDECCALAGHVRCPLISALQNQQGDLAEFRFSIGGHRS